jgi:hypothetical protein
VVEVRKLSRAGLIRKIDAAFSRFIRKRAADEYGFCTCVTCGVRLHWSEIQAGHWIKRGHAGTRWDERNVYPQCPGDNLYKDGLQDVMGGHIMNLHGPETINELLRLKRTAKRWSMPELRELLDRYQET